MSAKVRLQKIIADAGVASRREAERLILDGLVTVNGKVVSQLGTKVEPGSCHVKVRGKLIQPRTKTVYYAVNKPSGFVTTLQDPEGRPTVQELLRGVPQRVHPVGRLDYNSEGLLLLTNDGELTYALTHPRHHIPKVYQVKVKGKPPADKLKRLRAGIRLPEGITGRAEIGKIRHYAANTALEITLYEGKKRQIRRMFEQIGHPVLKLRRIRIGPIDLGALPLGKARRLEAWEIARLKETVS
jgi:pseudouridine synthase